MMRSHRAGPQPLRYLHEGLIAPNPPRPGQLDTHRLTQEVRQHLLPVFVVTELVVERD
jgi:hypothetical protein